MGASSAVSAGTVLALIPSALVALAAVVPPLRVPVAVVLAIGAVVGLSLGGGVAGRVRERGVPRAAAVSPWAWAAPLPIAILLTWGLIPAPLAAADGTDCGSALSPPALWRLAESLVVLVTIGVLARVVRSTRSELGLRRPALGILALSILALVVVAPLSVLIGPWLARPFFGEVSLPGASNPWAVVPAVIFASSNGTMEELAYRGVLQGWLGRVVGPTSAIVVQGALFGLQHSVGAEFVGPSLPVVAAMVAGGLLAGLIVRRTGSLSLPIALHVAFDVPLYYYWACRF